MKKLLLVLGLVGTLAISGCSHWENSIQKLQQSTLGGTFKVTLYSGGVAVRTWEVDGYISSETQTDGYFFDVDGQLVRITGDIVIEQID
jgi:hypothetical protein